jgi:hypothetical protein
MIYTPSYIFSLIFFIILLVIGMIILYNMISHIITYFSTSNKTFGINNDDYSNEEQLDFLKNTNSYNSAIKVALDKKNTEIFKHTDNNTLRDLLAFKFDNDQRRINNQINQIDLSGIDNSELKALNTFKNKINVNSINPEFDDYTDTLNNENKRGMSVVTNLLNPQYYLVNPLNKLKNQDVLNIQVPEDVNLNQIISDKIDSIFEKKYGIYTTQVGVEGYPTTTE